MTDNPNTLADRLEPCPNPWCESHSRPDRNYAPFIERGRAAPEMAVSCPVCPMRGPWADTEAEAITAWNTRAHPQPTGDVGALVERLLERDPFINDPITLKPRLHNSAGPQAAATILALTAEVERKDAVIAEANVSRNILRDTIRLLGIQVKGLAAALNGYRAAVSYIAADSWDGCSDCIEILRLARAADYDWHWTPDKIATELAALRAAIGKAEQ